LQKKEGVNFVVPTISSKTAEAIKRELKGMNLKFKRIKMPTGGATTFEIPTADPNNPKILKELVGVILYHHPVNIFWKDKSLTNSQPDCFSLDGEKGIGNPGGKCSICPYNQFKSGAKACKNTRRIYIIIDRPFPYELNLPPTSLTNFMDYVTEYAGAGYLSYEIVTKISLQRVTNKKGIAYAKATFSMAGVLDEKTKGEMAKMAQSIEVLSQQATVIVPSENEEEDENVVLDNFEEAPQNNDDDGLPF
jgi:hypothetical protein